MTVKGFTRNFKPLEILTEGQVEAIHRGALDVLESTGVRVEHDRALKLFEKNGCRVDYDEKRVRIPPGLVEECLRKTPSSFHMKARDPKSDLQIGGDTVYFRPCSGSRIVDLDTWETRPATRQERDNACIVMDALDNIHNLSFYPYFEVEGIPPVMAIPEVVAAMFRNSPKIQICVASDLDCEIFNIEMAKAVGTEIMSIFAIVPPLTIYAVHAECLFRTMEAGLPILVGSDGAYGATAPATIAGSIVQSTASNISGIVLAQLIKPGARVLIADFSHAVEMRSGVPVYGGIESALHSVMFNQVWRKYGIPTATESFGPSSSKRIDFQCGYEKATGALIAALAGSNSINFHGDIYGEISWHPVQAVLDDDIAGRVGHFLEGALVNDETLAIDLINEVGPIPGMYLDKAHTRQWWQKEQFMPKAADRLSYPEWMEQGKKSALDYAKERVEEIIATHKPKPLTASQDEEIERILEEARTYYKKRGLI